MKRIITIEEAAKISNTLRDENKTIVLTGGCFDILHIGHIALLENAKKQGDILMVLLESDEKIKQLKGADRPIHTQQERALMLASLRYVDYVIVLPMMTNDEDYDNVVQTVKPHVIATTENDPQTEHKKRQAKKVDAKLVYVVQYILHTSSSKLVEKLQKDL
jgi:rfaE bifunctional protein nucleotidyltransferase chain/domain